MRRTRMPPIRTGLDERMKSIQQELKEYFEEAQHVYADAIDAFTKLDSQVYSEAKAVRAKAREVNWDLTNNLLLILSLNQPLMKDLRIVATYLRAVDTVERLIRHARDIARSHGAKRRGKARDEFALARRRVVVAVGVGVDPDGTDGCRGGD